MNRRINVVSNIMELFTEISKMDQDRVLYEAQINDIKCKIAEIDQRREQKQTELKNAFEDFTQQLNIVHLRPITYNMDSPINIFEQIKELSEEISEFEISIADTKTTIQDLNIKLEQLNMQLEQCEVNRRAKQEQLKKAIQAFSENLYGLRLVQTPMSMAQVLEAPLATVQHCEETDNHHANNNYDAGDTDAEINLARN